MPNALQCPACGHKHRLSTLSGDPLFTCTNCGRLLKLPAEFRRPEPSGPAEALRPSASARVSGGGAPRRDPLAPPPGAPRATSAPRPPRPRGRPTTDMALPLRILAWVVAVGVGGLIVRWFARITGWLTGDSLLDLITGSGILRYFRIFTIVPFWALVTAGLATLFIEGGRWLGRRRDAAAGRGPRPVPAAAPAAARAKATPKPPQKQPKTRRPAAARATPPPAPAPAPKPAPAPAPAPSPSVRSTKPVAPQPAADGRTSSGTANAPRPRRIPRRDVPS